VEKRQEEDLESKREGKPPSALPEIGQGRKLLGMPEDRGIRGRAHRRGDEVGAKEGMPNRILWGEGSLPSPGARKGGKKAKDGASLLHLVPGILGPRSRKRSTP